MHTLADKVVQLCKIVEQQQQKERPVINCDGHPLDNVFRFKYNVYLEVLEPVGNSLHN